MEWGAEERSCFTATGQREWRRQARREASTYATNGPMKEPMKGQMTGLDSTVEEDVEQREAIEAKTGGNGLSRLTRRMSSIYTFIFG